MVIDLPLFAYGTLQHPQVIAHVIGRVPDHQPATLRDFARYRIQDAWYPGLMPEANALTDGLLFAGLTEDDWVRLDAYEDELYERRTVTAYSGTGDTCRAWTYVIPVRHRNVLTSEPWDLKTYRPGPNTGIA
jgi:gamma-glutamylcyclotransferase (GGCT)/AIG2-like uncharacterized protein YtfP